jgi:acyl carrier protein
MAKIMLPDVGEILEAVHGGVERRLGRKRKLYTGEDLIEDVGLTSSQFDELIAELEHRFAVEIDPGTPDQTSVAGALVVRLLRLCSEVVDLDTPDCAAA